MIVVEKLEKKFGKLHVLNGINVSIPDGRVTAVIGHNGSGKTTLIKSILGMVIPDSGAIIVNDINIRGQWKYRNNIGYMPQIGRYPDNMKIAQILSMMKDLRGESENLDMDLIARYQLEAMGNKSMRTLSGGTRQKVSAALAFLFNPRILILDEPTAGLDPVASEILREKILSEKAKGKLIIISSHIMSEVEELADDIVFISDGQVKFHKSTAELRVESGEERIGKALAKILSKYD